MKAMSRARRFAQSEEGSSTIEAVLWVPGFVFLLFMVTDISFVFNGRSEIMRIIQDGNRSFSVGRLTSVEETEIYIETQLEPLSLNIEVETVVDAGIITSVATVPVDDLVIIGTVPGISNFDMTIRSQHYVEY
jgi:hypothetical protein